MRRLVLTLGLVVLVAAGADARTSAKRCRKACGAAVTACVDAGTKRRKCRKLLVRQCRREGVGACAVEPGPATTTTPTTSTTSTTLTTGAVVNGCDPRFAMDLRGQAEVVVRFGVAPDIFDYAPECIAVSPGTTVRFQGGTFDFHPLVGGEIVNGTPQPDPASPFGRTTTGTTKSFALPSPGVFPYYCDNHYQLQMWGAVVVLP
jgi:plastocyanin